MVEESKYCTDIMEKHFNKELVIAKKDGEDFKNSTKCWIYDNVYVDDDAKMSDHCHITGKYRGSVCKDCNIKIKLNHKIPFVFLNLKYYDYTRIIQKSFKQELGKFNFKINAIPSWLGKYMSFYISNKLRFINSFIRKYSYKFG